MMLGEILHGAAVWIRNTIVVGGTGLAASAAASSFNETAGALVGAAAVLAIPCAVYAEMSREYQETNVPQNPVNDAAVLPAPVTELP